MHRRIVSWMLVLLIGGAGVTVLAQSQPHGGEDASNTVMGTTLPSQRLQLSFDGPGIIRQVLVKEGDRVKKGQELMSEDDRMEQKLLEAMQLEANSDLPIQFAQKTLEDSQTKLKRFESMKGPGSSISAASPFELLEAQLNVTLSQIKLQQAKQEQKQKKLQADRQKIKVELMHLNSPVDGIVEQLNLGPGEVVDPSNPNKPACVVVMNDPLWVEIHIPSRQAADLSLGDSMQVLEEGQSRWNPAKVIYLAPVADAASGTRLVRLEMPNPADLPSGLQVQVKLPDKLVSVANRDEASVAKP